MLRYAIRYVSEMSIERQLLSIMILSFGIAIISSFSRALWIDEYWSYFFSDQNHSIFFNIKDRMRVETHPPMYYMILYTIRGLFNDPHFLRLFVVSIFYIVSGSLYLSTKSTEKKLFILLISISYWFIYYSVEIRAYGITLLLSMATLLIGKDILERPFSLKTALAWCICGFMLGATNYFGAMWYGLFALVLCTILIQRLRRKQTANSRYLLVVIVGGVLMAAVTVAWIIWSFPTLHIDASSKSDAWGNFFTASSQGMRALLKTLFCNLALTCLAIMGVTNLFRRADAFDIAIAITAGLTIFISLIFNTFVFQFVKERTFIMLVPSFFMFFVRAAMAAQLSDKRTHQLWRAVPLVAGITPILFMPEYIKDVPAMGRVTEVISQAGQCDKAPILIQYRSSYHPEYDRQFAEITLSGGKARPEFMRARGEAEKQLSGPVLVDASQYWNGKPLPETNCHIKAVLLNMPRRKTSDAYLEGTKSLIQAGLPLDDMKEHAVGIRHYLFEE